MSLKSVLLRTIIVLLTLLSLNTHAAAPTVDYLFPAGAQRGTTVTVTASGKIDPWPSKVWVENDGLDFKPAKETGQFNVTVATNVPYGAYLVRFYNDDGASDLRTFVVGRQIELLEKEPNDSFPKPQSLEKLPVVINGKLDKGGDVDSFSLKVEAGRWIVAMVESYSLGAPVDAYLHLFDERGVKIAMGNDSYNLDPVLAFKAPKSGTYTLQIAGFVHPPAADVRFAGSASTLYRLTVTDGPVVTHAFPVAVEGQGKLQLQGWNLDAVASMNANGPIIADQSVLNDPRVEHRLRFTLGNSPESSEREPNQTFAEAQSLTIPGTVNGCLDKAGDEDRFAFAAKKGDKLEFRLASETLGFPVTAVLRLEDDAGKQLARADMSVTLDDPRIAWTAPADGKFALVVSDLYRHGGPDHLYRLEALPQVPSFSARTDNQRYRIDPGKSVELKVTVMRTNGFDGKLNVTAFGLPQGVTAKEAEVPAKGGEVKLTLAAAADAKPTSQPIEVVVVAPGEKPASAKAVFEFKARDAKTGDFLLRSTDRLWLTLPVASASTNTVAEPKKKKKSN